MDNTSIEASSSINKMIEGRDYECFLFFLSDLNISQRCKW